MPNAIRFIVSALPKTAQTGIRTIAYVQRKHIIIHHIAVSNGILLFANNCKTQLFVDLYSRIVPVDIKLNSLQIVVLCDLDQKGQHLMSVAFIAMVLVEVELTEIEDVTPRIIGQKT